jgi:hypothetical protein
MTNLRAPHGPDLKPEENGNTNEMNPSRCFLIRPSTFFTLLVWLCFSSIATTQTLAQDPDSKAPEKITPLFGKARQAEQRRDFVEAARLYDQVLKIDPGRA